MDVREPLRGAFGAAPMMVGLEVVPVVRRRLVITGLSGRSRAERSEPKGSP